MSFTLGPFLTCFIVTIFLVGYLRLIIHKSPVFFEQTIKFSLIGIIIILIRMAIPVNFSFTYTIYSYQALPKLVKFSTSCIPNTNLRIDTLFFFLWFLIAAVLLIKLIIQYIQLQRYLFQFCIDNNSEYSYLFKIVHNYYTSPIKIAVIPEPISPAITGFINPILILPDITGYSLEELDYICHHELAHYKKRHLLLGLLMEIVCRLHWWNPFVYYLKSEFALFLELSNDFFLIHSASAFNVTNYAELIIKTAKRIQTKKQVVPSTLMNFTLNTPSILTTRINFILNSDCKNTQKLKSFSILNRCIICVAVLLSIFIVPEASFRKINVQKDREQGIFEITKDNAYIIDMENGNYSIYVDGNHFGDIDHLIEEWKDIPIYKKGENTNEK